MVSSFLVAVGFAVAAKIGYGVASHVSLALTVLVTTVVWISVAYLTQPSSRATLVAFYRLVRPAGPGWNGIREESGAGGSPDKLPLAMLGWTLGCAFIYSALFGAGSFLYGRQAQGFVWLAVFAASGFGLLRVLPKLWQGADAR
jgi:hypothetical protein